MNYLKAQWLQTTEVLCCAVIPLAGWDVPTWSAHKLPPSAVAAALASSGPVVPVCPCSFICMDPSQAPGRWDRSCGNAWGPDARLCYHFHVLTPKQLQNARVCEHIKSPTLMSAASLFLSAYLPEFLNPVIFRPQDIVDLTAVCSDGWMVSSPPAAFLS